MTLHYDLLDAEQTRPLITHLRDLYAEVYAEPPYHEGPEHVARFAGWLRGELDQGGFSLARATDGDTLAGIAYGYTMPAGEWFHNPTAEPPNDIKAAPKFAVMEWAVRAPYRRAHVGRRLLDLVLANRPEPYAVLTTNPAAAARTIYERWGWQQHGAITPKTMPGMDVMVLSLRDPRSRVRSTATRG